MQFRRPPPNQNTATVSFPSSLLEQSSLSYREAGAGSDFNFGKQKRKEVGTGLQQGTKGRRQAMQAMPQQRTKELF